MGRHKSDKPKRNVWKEPSRYGTYEGARGDADDWRAAFGEAMGLPEAKKIIGSGNAWEILGLKVGSSWSKIKSAWRVWALKWHPDKNRGNEKAAAEEFKRGKAAYVVLGGKD